MFAPNFHSSKVREQGFSLIELLMVIAIMGLLASLLIVNLTNSTRKSRDAKRRTDFSEIRKALQLYFDDHRQFPPNTDDDGAGWDSSQDGEFIQTLVQDGYLKEVVIDPRNVDIYEYRYRYFDQGETTCGSFYILGVQAFEQIDPIESFAECDGVDYDELFAYSIMVE